MIPCQWVFAVLVVPFATAVVATTIATVEPGTGTTLSYPKPWLAELFYDALRDFAVSADVGNSACRSQTKMYRKHLENGSHWAVQMSDSWTRYPTGVLVSTPHQMGVYAECVDVHRPIQGMYCLPDVLLKSTTDDDYMAGKPLTPAVNENAWREIFGFAEHSFKIYRNRIKFSICIPDSCTAQDLKVSLQREFDKRFLPHRVKAEVHVESILCSTDKDIYPFDTGFYFTSILIGLIMLLCGFSTVYHFIILMKSNNGEKFCKMSESLRWFSIIHNGKELSKFDKNNELNLFNGLKVLTMLVVLFGHRFLYVVSSPFMNGQRIEQIYTNGPDILLTCMNLVDPFFYITGYLMYILLKPQLQRPETNWIQIPKIIIYKYLRLLPPYGMLMLLTAFVIPHMGDGPLWASKQWPEAEKCKTYWWANILAVSNFIEVDHQCLIVGWYVSCLLQFVVIGTIVIYVCAKNKRIGIYLVVMLLVTSMVLSFAMTYYHRAYGIIKLVYSFFLSLSNSFEFKKLYRPFYLRGIPFYAGILAGMVSEEMKKREIKFTPLVVYFSTFVVIVICSWLQLYGKVFYQQDRPYDVLEQSIYSIVSHCTWTTILFWITVCYVTSGYGPLEKLLNNRFMVILGRLSYAVYLVNITVIMIIESKQRAALYLTADLMVDGWIFSTIRIYLMGLLLYFTVEAPFGILVKTLLQGKTSSVRDKAMNTTNVKNTLETAQKDSTHL